MLSIVNTVGPANARIMLVGGAPGKEEQMTGEPFAGTNGRVLNQLLSAAGLYMQSCLRTNVARQMPPGKNISIFFEDRLCTKPKPMLREWMSMLAADIQAYKPNVIVAMGRTALWALTGFTKISQFRGYICECSLVPGFKVLPTFDPRYVIENWKESFTVVMDLRKAVRESTSREMPPDTRTLIPEASLEEWIKYCTFLAEQECPVAFDIETTGNRCHTHRVGFAHNANFGMSIGILNGIYPKYSTADEVAFWDSVTNVLNHCPVILQNGSFDIGAIFHHVGVLPKKLFFDTHIAAHVVWPETPRSLSYLASMFLTVPAWKHTGGDDNGLYNAADCANTYGIYQGLKAEIDAQGLTEVFMFEMSQIYPAVMLQLQGILIDEDRRQKIACFAQEEMDEIQEGLNRILKKDINMRSPKQMQQLLYIDLGLPVQYKRRKSANDARTVTTDATALANLERTCKHPALSLIMRYKKLDKLVSNFLDIEVSPEGRVHTCYNITGATMRRENKGFVVDDEDSYRSFGRWSSSGSIILPYGPGNLQNIPKEARKIFVPPKGYILLQADYKQAEAVVVAYLINDVKLKKLFQDSFGKSDEECKANGWDVHKITAASMFGCSVLDVTKDQRTVGKTIRHATNYSAGPDVVANRLGITRKEAKSYLDRYHAGTPQLHLWHQRIQDELQRTRVLTNLFGRKHRFLDRWGDSLFRSAYSFIPQSTVGDLLNHALINIYNNLNSWCHLALQLHDAVYVYIKPHELNAAIEAMRENMLIPLYTDQGEQFTIDVDFSWGDTWGEMETVSWHPKKSQ
jgi:uracil-DNA glycosylase family 4